MMIKFSFKYAAAALILPIVVAGHNFIGFAQPTELSIRDRLRLRIEDGGLPLKISVGREPIHAAVVLPIFYERRVYQPAWTAIQGALPQTDALIKAIRKAEREGLRPGDYHLAKIEVILAGMLPAAGIAKAPDPGQLVDLDLLLTDAFLILGSHLLAGRINPEKIHPQWLANRREADLAQLLEDALSSNRIEEALANLLPAYDGYHLLRDKLEFYRNLDKTGGWPTIPPGSKLQPGEHSARIPLLRQRLAAEGLLVDTAVDDQALFDSGLEQALKRFQEQNGLAVDGILGAQTLQALNISAGQRARQIAVNMERWRWLPQDLGSPHILVNIASFNLKVVERQTPVLNMRVVVGRTYRKTPVFSDKITYLVANPYWAVPDSIARKDLLPKIKKEPNFLMTQKIRVFDGWGGNSKEIEPTTINWNTVTAANLSYRFTQDPGPQNALGRIKFMFPNQFNVYLHDTPSKELFGKARRDFSSGCIRVEKPVELAEFLLRNQPDWPPEKIRTVLTAGDFTPRTVKLTEPVNVHILYWTVWVGEEGRLQFGIDIYNRDAMLEAALQEMAPSSMQ